MWVVHALLLTKPGKLAKLYLGSCTDPPRSLQLEHELHKSLRKEILCWTPIGAVQVLIYTTEDFLSHFFAKCAGEEFDSRWPVLSS